jgi:C1A family cysteine protease
LLNIFKENMTGQERIYNLSLKRLDESELEYGATSRDCVDGIDWTITSLPSQVDLRNRMPPVVNQGGIGSCTANALAAVYSHRAYQRDTVAGKPNLQYYIGSRLFLYYNERDVNPYTTGDTNRDSGCTLVAGVNSLKSKGICDETLWPYVDNGAKYKQKPTPNCYVAGLQHIVTQSYNVVQTIDSMKQTLAAGNPFVVGIAIYNSFESDKKVTGDPSKGIKGTGMIPMPNPLTEQLLGGHAIACVGYDDQKQVWIMRNSWGTEWGDQGHFYLPYAYLTDPSLSSDMWIITAVK